MRAYLALSIAAVLVGAVQADCDACIDGRCYRKHALYYWGDMLDIDRNRNIVYFKQFHTMQACQLDQDHCNGTDITAYILEIAVDQRTGDTYCHIHDDDGESLYKADFVNNEMELLVRGGVNYITFRDKLYYSTDVGIYTYEGGESRLVAGSEGQNRIFTIIVDKWGDIYFTTHLNMCCNYVIRRLSKGVVDQDVYWEGSYIITVDRDGNAVFIDRDSHVVYRVTNGKQAEVGAIKDLIDGYNSYVTPVFDRENNIIYSTGSINYYHLKQEKDMHVYCTTSIGLGHKRIFTEIISNTPAYYNVETTPSSSPDESGASDSAIPGPQPHTEHEQQSRCNCQCPKLPNISIKVEFN